MAAAFLRRPGKGGGYLNGVSGVIQSIIFVGGKSGENEYGPWTSYSAKITILPDGADTPVDQYAPAGFLRGDLKITKDGDIEGDDTYALDTKTDFGKFVVSLIEGEGNRFPEDRLGDGKSYAPVAGTRVTFSRQYDDEKTADLGKRSFKGRDGKNVEVPQDVLLVKEVLSLPGEKAGKATKAAGKVATKAAPATNDTDATDAALKAILGAAKDRTLSRSKVSSSVIGYALKAGLDGTAREAIRKQLSSDEYVADAVERGLIVVDGEGKAANLILATD